MNCVCLFVSFLNDDDLDCAVQAYICTVDSAVLEDSSELIILA